MDTCEYGTLTDESDGQTYKTVKIGEQSRTGEILRSTSGWTWNGKDTYSFSALPAGQRLSDGEFNNVRTASFFWSSTEYSGSNVYMMYLHYISREASLFDSGHKDYGYSVRCVMD